jgi:phosphatidylglycerophosphatase A
MRLKKTNIKEMKIENKKRFFLKTIVTFFGVGLSKIAPGTCGSLATIPFFMFLSALMVDRFVMYPFEFFSILIIALTAIGYVSTYFYMIEIKNSNDPQEIVIDEVVGQLITYFLSTIFVAYTMKYTGVNLVQHRWFLLFALIVSPFLLFRFYDIKKPLFIGYIDRKYKDATGVMLDDIIAGVFAAITNGLLIWGLTRVLF